MIRASIFVIGLILMAAMQGNIDDLVEAKKQRLLRYNSYAKDNPELLRNKAFCLCSKCLVLPLMHCDVMISHQAAYGHRNIVHEGNVITGDSLN